MAVAVYGGPRGPTASEQDAAKGLRHPSDPTFVEPREERERERASRHVFADGKLALPVAEALPVERHQVDGGKVGLAGHPLLCQGADCGVAVDAARELHHEHEPAAAIAPRVGAWQFELVDAGQGLAVAIG